MGFIKSFVEKKPEGTSIPENYIEAIDLDSDFSSVKLPGYTWSDVDESGVVPEIEIATDYP